MAKAILTQARLKELFHYNPDTGIFTRIKTTCWRVAVGQTLVRRDKDGYFIASIDYRNYRAARLAFLYMTGSWPQHLVDHIDGCRSNDAWGNLREATAKQNGQNRTVGEKGSTSPLLGVNWDKARGKWLSRIALNGKAKNLGRFDTPEEAHAAYVKAKRELHPFGTL